MQIQLYQSLQKLKSDELCTDDFGRNCELICAEDANRRIKGVLFVAEMVKNNKQPGSSDRQSEPTF